MYSEILYKVSRLSNGDKFVEISFNRPQAANAMAPAMLRELDVALAEVKKTNPRLLLLTGAGKNFCAGADLRWMKESGETGIAQNMAEARLLARFFSALSSLEIPVVAVVKGAVFGGGVGVVACCDYALATPDAHFCLSEVRIGLVPALILPYIAKKMPRSFLLQSGLTGEVFDGERAGLVSKVIKGKNLQSEVEKEINTLLKCAPQAQCKFKKLVAEMERENFKNTNIAIKSIAEARSSPEAKEGIDAFFAKTSPPWAVSYDRE